MRSLRSLAVVVAGIAGALVLAASAAGAPPSPTAASRTEGPSGAAATGRTAAAAGPPAVRWQLVTDGLDQPTDVVAAPDGSPRLFVVEKTGLVRIWVNGRLLRRPYLDIRNQVSSDSERGLLSIAFASSFERRPVVYVYYTRRDGDVVVERFRASSATAGHVATSSGRVLLRIEHSSQSNHDGGQLAFGPDGLLYVGVGDGGSQGDPNRNGQRRTTLLGKVLRLDVSRSCGGQGYCIPAANPYAGPKPGRGEIYLIGLRNPWRFSFDPATRDLWIGDVGQDAWEEIDRLGPAAAGANLGWSCWEARQRYNADQCRPGVHYRFPVVAVPHPQAESIIGGYVYRGRAVPRLRGTYVFGDNATGKVWTYRPGGTRVLRSQRLPGVTSFGVTDSGELLAVGLGGQLWRLRS